MALLKHQLESQKSVWRKLMHQPANTGATQADVTQARSYNDVIPVSAPQLDQQGMLMALPFSYPDTLAHQATLLSRSDLIGCKSGEGEGKQVTTCWFWHDNFALMDVGDLMTTPSWALKLPSSLIHNC